MKDIEVVALGELVIDLTQSGQSPQGNPLLEANPGGAPCNVLAMLSKLGHRCAFIGKVGQDAFGSQLEAALRETGIVTDGLRHDSRTHTTLAIVHTLPGGDRDFSFYRSPGADMMLTEAELDTALLQGCRIFHFGSLSMTDEPCRTATKRAIALAEQAGALLSFDPNLRPPLWHSPDEAREQILYGLAHCHILKISDNEIQWLSGKKDYDEGIAWLQSRFDIPLILLSMGKDGSRAYQGGLRVEVPAVAMPDTIETTGAGDTFFGAVLHCILENGFQPNSPSLLTQMLRFANAAAAVITTRKGALRVMPGREEIQRFI